MWCCEIVLFHCIPIRSGSTGMSVSTASVLDALDTPSRQFPSTETNGATLSGNPLPTRVLSRKTCAF